MKIFLSITHFLCLKHLKETMPSVQSCPCSPQLRSSDSPVCPPAPMKGNKRGYVEPTPDGEGDDSEVVDAENQHHAGYPPAKRRLSFHVDLS